MYSTATQVEQIEPVRKPIATIAFSNSRSSENAIVFSTIPPALYNVEYSTWFEPPKFGTRPSFLLPCQQILYYQHRAEGSRQSRVPVERSGNTVFHPRFGRNHKFISSPCKEYIFIVLNVPTVIRDIGTFRATVLFLTFINKSYWSPLPFPAHPSHFDVFQLRFDALLAPSHPTWALSMGVHQGTHLVFLCAMILHNIATRETR